jgi:hypothetical protein
MNALSEKLTSHLSKLSLFGRGGDDPLTNLKTATRWAEQLPAGDPVKSQDALVKELRRFNENLTDFSKDRLSVLMMLDEKARDLQDTLVRQYLRNPRMSRAVESQLWHAVYSLYWEVARGYHLFVRDYSQRARKCPYEATIPLVTLRAIRIFGQLLKWRAVRYLQPGEKLWLRLHSLYRIAESEGFHQLIQQAYPEEAQRATCESTYMHALMLNLANSGTLYPRQIDLVDRWLHNWHAGFKLECRFDPSQHSFCVDLSLDQAPRRARNAKENTLQRCWSTAALLTRLVDIKADIQRGTSPAMLGLTEDARTAEAVDLLRHLERQWGALPNREQRRAPRNPIKRLVDLAHGFGNIVNQLKTSSGAAAASPYNNGTGLDYVEANDVRIYGFVTQQTRERSTKMKTPAARPSGEVERWVMHDESESGFGSIVENTDRDWLRVGALVAVQGQDLQGWRIGILRRLARLDDEASSVGIEMLKSQPRLVMLYDTHSSGYTVDGFDNSGAQLPIPGVWLANSGSDGSLIIDPALFYPGRVFKVDGMGERKYVALGRPHEHSEGWMHVSCTPVEG